MVGKISEICFAGDFGYMRFHDLRHPYVKHTTKNFSCKSRNPKPSNVMVWDFCFDYKFLDALVHLNSSS